MCSLVQDCSVGKQANSDYTLTSLCEYTWEPLGWGIPSKDLQLLKQGSRRQPPLCVVMTLWSWAKNRFISLRKSKNILIKEINLHIVYLLFSVTFLESKQANM